MSHLREGNPEENADDGHGFKWGAELGVGKQKKDVVFYESFAFDGDQYFLYDCVYFSHIAQPEASIGKLVKMFEGPDHLKKVKVIWFLRPCEIKKYLGNYEPRWNEIFLAFGKGRGVSNINLVETICGKCNVVCTSNDYRNPQASEADVRRADHFFRCHFDVGEFAIWDVFPDLIDGVKVERFFNKKTKQKPSGPLNPRLNVKEQHAIPSFSLKLKEKKTIGNFAKDDNSCSKVNPLVKESKTVPVSMSKQLHLPNENTLPRLKTSVPNGGAQHVGSSRCQVQDKVDKAVEFIEDTLIRTAEVQPYKKRKLLLLDEIASGNFDNRDCQQRQDRGISIENQLVQRKLLPDEMASSKFDNPDCQQRQDRGISIEYQLIQRKLLPDEMASSKFDNQDCQQRQDRGTNVDNKLVMRKLLPDEMISGKFDNQNCQRLQNRGTDIDNQLVKTKLAPNEMESGKFDNQDGQQRQDRGTNIDNQLVQRKLLLDEMPSGKYDNGDCQQQHGMGINIDNRDRQERQDRVTNIDNQLVKRKLLPDEMASGKFDNRDCRDGQDMGINIDNQPVQRKLLPDELASSKFDNRDCQQRQDRGINIDNQVVQVSSSPADRRNWFKQLPWEQRLERAQEAGTLVSLENLDASYSSEEVEDLLWDAFKEKVEAKMIEKSTFCCPDYGKAFIIFNSKEAAVSAISQLMSRCLMLADGRPVVARKGTFRKPVKLAGFAGHLTVKKVQFQRQNEEKKKAKSTSHAAQPNNIEYEMGMQWRVLQEKSDMYWKALHEQQAKELQDVQKQPKLKSSS